MKYVVRWTSIGTDGEDRILRPFDTVIECKAYIDGIVDSVVWFADGADETKVRKELKYESIGES